jgi:hypothetical protein
MPIDQRRKYTDLYIADKIVWQNLDAPSAAP